MQSISVFNCQTGFDIKKLKNVHSDHQEKVNGQNEKLTTNLYVNEDINIDQNTVYKKCIVSMDEVIKIKARVFGKNVNEVIVQNSYDIYVNESTGALSCLANKNSADQIQKFLSDEFDIIYDRKIFDLNNIMSSAHDVKRAQFRKLTIQTLSGSAISGNQVNSTAIYNTMNQAGDLSTIAVVYPFNSRDINFSVSSTGSIVLFSTLDDNEITDFILNLEQI
ncbi:hypothetical protein [Limosilactobacillus fermentum]|uniref:hypothetical protein n=1 Tax=Limosilactobacillus fermentum TaxID=1613 RepID=UPI0022EBEA2D|nr:hypothetical protein [Limosilactobacillus fermentum]MDA3723677.1 hypothetical protein [Limosilactobacillus fermentum]MDA3762045.1 hypothetical protein [Limosilactobacillus fermentum]